MYVDLDVDGDLYSDVDIDDVGVRVDRTVAVVINVILDVNVEVHTGMDVNVDNSPP